jgi:electron transfer flavoprotein beta subunit
MLQLKLFNLNRSDIMKILVCVKHVPESETAIDIQNDSKWVDLDSFNEFKMNRLDEFAVEEAVRIKENFAETNIDIVSVGPDRATEGIKRSIGMGADNGIHIISNTEAYLSPMIISSWIAQHALKQGYDLIFTGAMSDDGMGGQIGPMLAAHLRLPCATGVIYEKLSAENNSIYVEREIEGGKRDTLELSLPAVLTIQSGINTPRYPSLSNLLRANKQELVIIDPAALSPPETGEEIARVTYPEKSRAGTVLEGTAQEKARLLLQMLRERALLE